jgi:hypothetical protein
MRRAMWIGLVCLGVLAVAATRTAWAEDVWEKVTHFTFHSQPPAPKNVNVNSDPILDAALIKAGLRTATPEEHGFVDRVVDLAKRGVISPALVESSFQWARKRPFQHRFQYFKLALIERAKKDGVDLDRLVGHS